MGSSCRNEPKHQGFLPETLPLQKLGTAMTALKFEVAKQGLSTFNTLHFSDFCLQVYRLVNKSFTNYAGMAHFLIESQVPLF